VQGGGDNLSSNRNAARPRPRSSHIAIAEILDGKAVEWMEHVTDEQYGS